MTLSTRIAVMNAGYVQQLGTPKEIYDTPANLFVASFMVSPSMNLLPVTVRADENAIYAEIANCHGETVRLAFAETSEALKACDGQQITLGVQPEAITDPDGADRKSRHIEIIKNVVEVTEPAGSDTFVASTLGRLECIARMCADADVQVNQVVDFAVNMEKAVPFDPKAEARIA